jgi:hypothetical protein
LKRTHEEDEQDSHGGDVSHVAVEVDFQNIQFVPVEISKRIRVKIKAKLTLTH